MNRAQGNHLSTSSACKMLKSKSQGFKIVVDGSCTNQHKQSNHPRDDIEGANVSPNHCFTMLIHVCV